MEDVIDSGAFSLRHYQWYAAIRRFKINKSSVLLFILIIII
jgi:hypothetical protein